MKKILLAGVIVLTAASADLLPQTSPSLIASAKKGNAQQVSESVKAGADVNSRDEFGATALMWGALRGYHDVVAVLLSLKADPNLQDTRGQTALHRAAMRGKSDIVKLLLDSGADRTLKDAAGKDAAAIAVENSYHDIAAALRIAPPPQTPAAAPVSSGVKPSGETAVKLRSEKPSISETLSDTPVSLREYYPAKTGDSWVMSCVTGVDTIFYVLEASPDGAVLQCESKKGGKRVDYYRQTMTFTGDLLKVSALGRDEVLMKEPVSIGSKWFVERSGVVFAREITETNVLVSFAGREYSCVVVRDIIPSAEKGKRSGARKEAHYHCYAKGIGYLGTKTASFEKTGDVEHIPAFAEIPSWFLARQRSAN
jgi:hypothetical protein